MSMRLRFDFGEEENQFRNRCIFRGNRVVLSLFLWGKRCLFLPCQFRYEVSSAKTFMLDDQSLLCDKFLLVFGMSSSKSGPSGLDVLLSDPDRQREYFFSAPAPCARLESQFLRCYKRKKDERKCAAERDQLAQCVAEKAPSKKCAGGASRGTPGKAAGTGTELEDYNRCFQMLVGMGYFQDEHGKTVTDCGEYADRLRTCLVEEAWGRLSGVTS